MCHYHHFTTKERECLLVLRNSGKNISEIARIMGRNKSTISRELKRNSVKGTYSAFEAEKRYRKRRRRCGRKRLLADKHLLRFVRFMISQKHWSPEQIANILRAHHAKWQVSYPTIYRSIHRRMLETRKLSHGERGFARHLRHKGKRRRKDGELETRGKICISHPISERPEEANMRLQPGHLEADTVLGKRGGECIVTLVDRKLRLGWIERAKSKSAADVNDAMLRILNRLPAGYVKTITPDCGKEFADHASITSQTGIEFYFPPPGTPWLRGTNENFNGLLREFVPKGSDISALSDSQLAHFQWLLNTRPRKCLCWNSPQVLFSDFLLHLS